MPGLDISSLPKHHRQCVRCLSLRALNRAHAHVQCLCCFLLRQLECKTVVEHVMVTVTAAADGISGDGLRPSMVSRSTA